jgi:hypothetical protein
MKEVCEECRYYGPAVIYEQGHKNLVKDWCRMKRRSAPKNPCKFWRPKKTEEERNGQ